MTQLDFDFDSFQERVVAQQRQALEEATKGLKALEQERFDLEAKILELEDRRDDLDAKIERLREFVGAETPLADSSTPRAYGLQKAIMEEVFGKKLSVSDWLGLEDITVLVSESLPGAREDSVRGALRQLVKKGELEVRGKRGNREWQATMNEYPQEEPVAPTEPAPAPEESESPSPLAGSPLSGEDIRSLLDEEAILCLRDRLCGAILEALQKRPGGLDAKTIAWLIDQESATESDFQNAVQMLLRNKQVELAKGENGNGQVVRLPVDPDSREGLKQVHVQGNALFPGMEEPKHV
jgi:hypothetical protein